MSDFIPMGDGGGGGGGERRGSGNEFRGGRHGNYQGGGRNRGGGGGRYRQWRGGGGRARGGRGRGFHHNRGGYQRGGRGREHFQHGRIRHRSGGRGNQTQSEFDFSGIEEINAPPPPPPHCSPPKKQKCRTLRIAIQGCSHGQLDQIYSTLTSYHTTHTPSKPPIDLLLCCGDFQSIRNTSDLRTMAVPPKYQQMGTFHQYYSGAKVAPILTIFVGGNHEASACLQELYYGGWVAPNIYYLGAAGCVNLNNNLLRIAGLSGIYKSYHYHRGHFERPPYNDSTLRSVYHVRQTNVYRLSHLVTSSSSSSSSVVHIFMSHDWPRGIEQHGNTKQLLRKKKFFEKEVRENTLGSPACEEVLNNVRPLWWFAAHLHVKFSATVKHGNNGRKKDDDDEKVESEVKNNSHSKLVPSQVANRKKKTEMDTTTDIDKDDDTHNNVNNHARFNDDNKKSPLPTDYNDKILSNTTVQSDNATNTNTNTTNDDTTTTTTTTTTTSFVGLESKSCNNNTKNDGTMQDLTEQMTRFLSLDKCLPQRRHLQIINIPCFYDDDDDNDDYTEEEEEETNGNNNTNNDKEQKEKESNDDKEQNDKHQKNSIVQNKDDDVMEEKNDDNDDDKSNEQEKQTITQTKDDKMENNTPDIENKHEQKQQQQQQPKKLQLMYDLEWLVILQKTHFLTSTTHQRVSLPSKEREEDDITISKQDLEKMKIRLMTYRQNQQRQQGQDETKKGKDDETINPLMIPNNFVMTVPPYPKKKEEEEGVKGKKESGFITRNNETNSMVGNPQTDELLDILGLEHIVTVPYKKKIDDVKNKDDECKNVVVMNDDDDDDDDNQIHQDNNEINLDDDDDDEAEDEEEEEEDQDMEDQNEIDIDDDDDDDDDNGSNSDDKVNDVDGEKQKENQESESEGGNDGQAKKKKARTGSFQDEG